MWSSNKVFKDIKIFWTVHSRPFIRYQGKNLDWFWIWCCFQFFLHCLVQPNQVIHTLSYHFYHKNQTLNVLNSQLLLCMLLKYYSLKFSFLGVWHSETVSDSICNWLKFILIINTVGLQQNLALHWQQNSCPGKILIFLVFSAEQFREWSLVHL